MTTANPTGLNGHHHNDSQPCWEITTIRRVSADPAAWRGTTAQGSPIHLSYRNGLLRVELAEPSETHPGALAWRDLLVVRPDYIEIEIDLLRQQRGPLARRNGSLAAARQERRTIADWFALGECRADRKQKPPGMTFWRLRTVLEDRDQHLAYLSKAGAAGGPVRLVIRTFLEDESAPPRQRHNDRP